MRHRGDRVGVQHESLAAAGVSLVENVLVAGGTGSDRLVGQDFHVLELKLLRKGLNLAGAQDYVSDIVNGLALLVGVGITAQIAKRRAGA